MGVMLSLEGNRQIRRRHRGQHSRTTDDQACLDALAAFMRADAASAGRSLSRVSREALAVRLLPAAMALAQAADLALTGQAPWGLSVELDYSLSPACLLRMCTGSATGHPCTSPTCQHSCHGRPQLSESESREVQPLAVQPLAVQPLAVQPPEAQSLAVQPLAVQPPEAQSLAVQPLAVQPPEAQSLEAQVPVAAAKTYSAGIATRRVTTDCVAYAD
jgi:hypothetical protein